MWPACMAFAEGTLSRKDQPPKKCVLVQALVIAADAYSERPGTCEEL